MTLGEKIQDLRKKSGMSQDTLAEKLEVSRQAVSKWERDEAVPEADKIVRLAKLFGVSTDYLLMEESAPQSAPVQQGSFRSSNGFGRQLERFARRHGYKGGFIVGGIGAAICGISLILRAWINNAVSNMTGMFDSFTNSMFNDFGSMGGNMIPGYDSMVGNFQQAAGSFTGFASTMGNLFLIGLIPGIALIAAGVAIIVIGKKYAKEQA